MHIHLPKESSPDYDRLFSEHFDGQLAVDVYEASTAIVVVSLLAGVKLNDLDIALHNNMLTLKGRREKPSELGKISEQNSLCQECFWGPFSRSIILPADVLAEEINATLQNGVLMITLPKATKKKKINVLALD